MSCPKEEIIVTDHGESLYALVPMEKNIYVDAMSLIGILSKDATIDVDPNERD